MKKFWSILLMCALALSCTSEPQREVDSPRERSYSNVHYELSASGARFTKATLNGSTQYVFEAGDRLFVSHGDDLFGFMTLISGVGETNASFEGDLVCADDFDLSSSTTINVTLVSTADRVHSNAGGKITGTSYPAGEYASTLAEAVQKYSDFTCSTTFGSRTITLEQNSTFVVCKIKMPATNLPAATSVSTVLANSGTPLWNGTVTSTVHGAAAKLDFIVPLAGGSSLSSATLEFDWTDALDAPQSQDFDLTDKTLAANNYYTVDKSTFSYDGFRIKAISNETDVTFNYAALADNIEYSRDLGETWTAYTSIHAITLNADEEICFRGERTNYKNALTDTYGTPGPTPIFTATKKCYIAGNIMSLLEDEDNLVEDAFNGAFSKGSGTAVTYIDIDPDDPLILPVTTTAVRCYKGMFRKCTSLTHGPDLPATVMAADCYNSMFRDCSALVSVRCYFSCYLGGGYEKANYDRTSIMSWLDKWMDGITTTGKIYCHPDMVTYWTNSKNQNGPWWTTDYTKATMSKNWTAEEWSSFPN